MNRTQLIEKITEHTGVEKKAVANVLSGLGDVVLASVAKGDSVLLPGIAKFTKVKRKARIGRNPATGAAVKIPAKTVAKVTALKLYKETVLGSAVAPKLQKAPAAPKVAAKPARTPRVAAAKPAARTTAAKAPARAAAARTTAAKAPARAAAVRKAAPEAAAAKPVRATKAAAKPAAARTTTRSTTKAAAEPVVKATTKATTTRVATKAPARPRAAKKV